ncbi:DUF4919 domain-containing protein [Ferruginibacter sp. SUN002]|uniref:DUF4919 domain-containing protein n=1 Tax=Ferruginibacter sp. SUN002 TaxID=2937789 RepID=UPI003D36CFF8
MFLIIKKIAFVSILVVCAFSATAQNGNFRKPDYQSMKKTIADANSPFYYPPLMKRYMADDTTLTIEEYRYLYYGSSLDTGYAAYGNPSVREQLRNEKDVDKIIELEKKAIKEFPFNIRDIYNLNVKLEEKGDKVGASIYNHKLIGIVKAIMSTGDGLTDSTAMYVINVGHEYDLIGLLGYQFGGSQALIRAKNESMDKMKLKKNDDNIEYLYFNVDALFAGLYDLFKTD